MPRKLVGNEGKRKDLVATDVLGLWKTDVIHNRDPDYEYQFFHEHEVSDRLRPTIVQLRNFETNEVEVKHLPGWSIVQRDTGPEEAAGWRPDEGKPLDTVLRHGSMVCMKIKREHWEVLQKAQGQRAAAYDVLQRKGRKVDFNERGQEQAPQGGKPFIRVTEQPMNWERV